MYGGHNPFRYKALSHGLIFGYISYRIKSPYSYHLVGIDILLFLKRKYQTHANHVNWLLLSTHNQPGFLSSQGRHNEEQCLIIYYALKRK